MSARALVSTQKQSGAEAAPPISGVLQRKCACGNHTMSGECEECKSKKGTLQRASVSPRAESEGEVPPIVHEVLRSSGRPLDAATRAFMEPRFGPDLSRVQRRGAVPKGVQTELEISQPGDPYEQEADRIADRVMRMPTPLAERQNAPVFTQVERISRRQERGAQLREIAREPRSGFLPPGSGQPLPMSVRDFFEPRFGYDFSQVQIYTDTHAAKSARSIDALAYTAGTDIVFGTGQYALATPKGMRLLAHELAHVVQQGRSQPLIARQANMGEAIVEVEEEHKRPDELEASDAAAIGEEVLKTVGYEELIRLATEAGLLEEKEMGPTEAPIRRLPASVHEMIFRQGAEAAVTFGGVFTRYAVAAGITSQLDSPAPGPADLVALGILAVGLVAATYTVLSRDVCDAQLIRCLENVWQPDWNQGTFGPRKDCGACHRECKHAGGAWPYYKCPD